ncbi:hypothetical protein, variant [Salpingoeca rosetta]|nr:hypothetical protein, variant [Salpingoeca rosetta]EGD76314.1 hypothetical protein, variant [Salpingoeca rosetta]|eukprot:XP_004998489.1 hypothetical protein, variant [Salpingoeca rosetta]
MPLITVLLKELETLIGEDPVTFIYEDQTTNDFNSVFKRAHGLIPPPQSYKDDTPLQPFVQKYNNTFVMASGTSFYEQVTPNETVDLGISATAMHWLTSSPCAIPDALHSAYSKDAATLAKYEEQAFSDLLRIFQHRAAELKSGGQFVCINFAKDDKGQFLGHTEQTPACMHTTFYELWCEMADEGLITKQEVLNTNFPNQYRTIREHQRVLDDASLSSLEVQTLNTRVVPCPYRQSLLKGEIEPAKYAATFVPTTRTWSNSTFVSGLDDSRSAEEKDALVDEMFNRYAARISKNPTDHGMDYVHAYLAFAKK